MRALNSVMGIFVLLLALTTTASWAAAIDQRALDYERNKQIIPLDNEEIKKQYLQARDAINYDDYEQEDFSFSDDVFDDDDSSQTQVPDAMDEAEEKIQLHILWQIVAFERENQLYGIEIKALRRKCVKESKKSSQEFIPSDVARLIGYFFNEKNEYDLAIKFYVLAASSYRSAGEEHLEVGAMLVRYFNNEVALNKPKAPTSELFSAVRKAMWHYNRGSTAWEIGEYFADALTLVRDMMVRWPVSPAQLQVDDFYARNQLVQRLYDEKFVETLLRDVKKLNGIFNAKVFCAGTKDNNLLDALRNAGFKGVYKELGKNQQYIWVNPQGYIVRIKYHFYGNGEQSGTAKGEWQFTVGLTYINPFKWQGERVVGIKKSGDLRDNTNTKYVSQSTQYDDLATYQYNEIFKIVIDKELVMIAPAFRETSSYKSYWYLYGKALDEVMRKAHSKFTAPVTDFKKIEEHLHLDYKGNLTNQRVRRAPQVPHTVIGGGTPCKKQNLPKR